MLRSLLLCGSLLLLAGGCRTPFLTLPTGDAGATDLAMADQAPPPDLTPAFDFSLPPTLDLAESGDLGGLHGCQGYSRCVDNCENDRNCMLRCKESATDRAVFLYQAAVACGPAYCQLATADEPPRCDGQTDPPNTPSGTCVRCQKDAVANLLERVCALQDPDCNVAACLPAVGDCIKDGS